MLEYQCRSHVRAPGSDSSTMATDLGENCFAAPRPHLRLLPYIRGGHGIFSAPVTRRTQSESRPRCGFLRTRDVDPGGGRLRALRDLKLCTSRFFVGSQSRLLVGRRLPRRRAKRIFDRGNASLAKFCTLPWVGGWDFAGAIGGCGDRKSDGRNETGRENRPFTANAWRDFSAGVAAVRARNR